jgi:3-hydroxyisobutyrate dehydrogenase-like beta-hydroxyacid dehydrogenase
MVCEKWAARADIGFIGLSHRGFPIARRTLDAGHDLVVCSTCRRDTILDHEGADSDFTSAITPTAWDAKGD